MIPNFRSATLRQVLVVVTKEGEGTYDDVCREVTRYVDPVSGNVLAVNDPGAQHGEAIPVDTNEYAS